MEDGQARWIQITIIRIIIWLMCQVLTRSQGKKIIRGESVYARKHGLFSFYRNHCNHNLIQPSILHPFFTSFTSHILFYFYFIFPLTKSHSHFFNPFLNYFFNYFFNHFISKVMCISMMQIILSNMVQIKYYSSHLTQRLWQLLQSDFHPKW